MIYNHLMKEFIELIAEHGLTTMLDHIHAMVALVEKDGTLITWNRAFDSYKSRFPSSKKLGDYFPAGDEVQHKLEIGRQYRWVAELLQMVDGQPVHCDCILIPLQNEKFLFVAEYVHADIALLEKMQRLSRQVDMYKVENEFAKKLAQRKQAEVDGVMAQAQEILQVDSLTFLPNRRMIVRELQDETLRAERYNTQFSISVVDIDHFKKVNDTYGHLAGDEVLRSVALHLRDNIRHPDIAGRYGGEEFLILLPNSNSAAAAEQAARLCKQVREAVVQVKKHTVQVTISIGVAEFRRGVDTWETILNRADAAMYQAKRNGRDRWEVDK